MLYVSPSVKKVFGYESSELIGTNILKRVHSDDVQILMDEMFHQIESGAESSFIEFRDFNKAGRYVCLGGRATVLIDPITNELISIVSVMRDVTFERRTREVSRKRGNDSAA